MNAVAEQVTVERPPSLIRQALKLRRTQIGITIATLIAAVAILGPFVAPFGSTEFVDSPNLVDVPGTVFGTDYFGQDVFSRFLFGGRSILLLALAATGIGITLGTTLGLIAAYNRSRLDEIIMRTGDVMLAFPQLVLALLFISITGPNLAVIVLLTGLGHMPRVARVMRGATLSVAERDFVSNEIGRAHV